MYVEQAFQELEKVLADYGVKIKSSNVNRHVVNDVYHEMLKIKDELKDEIKKLNIVRRNIDKKLNSKEFIFIKNNFEITEKDLDPERYKSFEEIKFILEAKTYHAYNWDSFLEYWYSYYEIMNKIKYLLSEFKNKLKLINYYMNIKADPTPFIDAIIKE
ncbi:MAG: hypothetical protein RQ952_02335 [Thermoproteota archaeon]|jgi:hypothetical protein|nr:hypothetical protein [Thermoproteota archaeon]